MGVLDELYEALDGLAVERTRDDSSKSSQEVSVSYAELLLENARLRDAYSHIAHALACDYADLFYVDMDTDEYIVCHFDDESGELVERRRAVGFFENCEREAKLHVHPEDRAAFVKTMDREFLKEELNRSRVLEMLFRGVKDGRSFFVQLKATRMDDDGRVAVISISDVDELVTNRRAEDRIREERIVYARLHALTGNFIAVYDVDPETDCYYEFSSADGHVQGFTLAREGESFFEMTREAYHHNVYPADLSRFLSVFTKANVMAEINRNGIFTLSFRLVVEDGPIYVQIKVAKVEEDEGSRLIVGLYDIDAQVRQELEAEQRLAQAQSQAKVDVLTGVRNRLAYLESVARIDDQIATGQVTPFAIVMLDINDLKKVNDTAGHRAGDQYLREACKVICNTFKHSPVFRVGGDEFCVIAQGNDFECLQERLEFMENRNAEALRSGGPVIACGVAVYNSDACVSAVFERADSDMYANKCRQKAAYHS